MKTVDEFLKSPPFRTSTVVSVKFEVLNFAMNNTILSLMKEKFGISDQEFEEKLKGELAKAKQLYENLVNN
ncbi:MAG: hypothetical protein IPP61_13985 [Cytophagaceae bacterium]|jgi:hypothetical protein|nr:hypothetical protein [Cytophagaceae bacterium]MBK9932871.1 hypothetical protein [Cytophagaceae bacterium]MBL0303441.1 hypothetical protein [Cytophagaceae bacterium]MBL0326269.1 hypothetical protein [Cytophagaceae bacterium]